MINLHTLIDVYFGSHDGSGDVGYQEAGDGKDH